jgi:endoglucanase
MSGVRRLASVTMTIAMLLTTGAATATTLAAAAGSSAAAVPTATTASACPAHPTAPGTPVANAALHRQARVAARAHRRAVSAHARARRWHRRSVTARARGHAARARVDARHARLATHHARQLRKAASRAAAKLRAMRRRLHGPRGRGSCVYVRGSQLVDGNNQPIHPVGATRSGSEYACVQGWGMFDGPTDDGSIAAMTSWNVQIVRIPLNEDCWLGINGVNPDFAGATYRTAIEQYVARIEAHGMIVDLDLHWTAPAGVSATSQAVMADDDHSRAFWSSVATRYGHDHHVVFELFNEPHDISWACWRNGCTIPAAGAQPAWQAAGMQQLVTAVRSTGATNVVILGGLGWAGDISQWTSHRPRDPLGQEAAAWHIYNFGGCTDSTCWSAQAGSVPGIPVVVTEIGETDCGSSFVNPLMTWLDKARYSYLAWTWDDWHGCGGPSLLTSYDGTPNGAYGRAVRAHLRSRPALPR